MPIRLDKNYQLLRFWDRKYLCDGRPTGRSSGYSPLEDFDLNLMPQKKMVTETQLLRHLANTPLQLDIDFLYMETHRSKTTRAEHMETFYKTFPEVKDDFFDGMIITEHQWSICL